MAWLTMNHSGGGPTGCGKVMTLPKMWGRSRRQPTRSNRMMTSVTADMSTFFISSSLKPTVIMNTLILNRDFKLPGDGWYQVAPLGVFPHSAMAVVQVIDEVACVSIVNQFAEEAMGENFAGLLIDFDHFSLDAKNKSEAAGWVTTLEARLPEGVSRGVATSLRKWQAEDAENGGQPASPPVSGAGGGLTALPHQVPGCGRRFVGRIRVSWAWRFRLRIRRVRCSLGLRK